MTSMNEAWEAIRSLRKCATEHGYSVQITTDSVVDLAPPVMVDVYDHNHQRIFHGESTYDGTPDTLMDVVNQLSQGKGPTDAS